MELINDIDELKRVLANSALNLLYIQAPDCGLCSIMLDKVGDVAMKYPHMHAIRTELLKVPQVAGSFLVATAPTVLLFHHGKEVFRAGNFIDTSQLEHIISKFPVE